MVSSTRQSTHQPAPKSISTRLPARLACPIAAAIAACAAGSPGPLEAVCVRVPGGAVVTGGSAGVLGAAAVVPPPGCGLVPLLEQAAASRSAAIGTAKDRTLRRTPHLRRERGP